jgi:hypothetical protein
VISITPITFRGGLVSASCQRPEFYVFGVSVDLYETNDELLVFEQDLRPH